MDVFNGQKLTLHVQTACESGETAVCADDPVAGDEDGNAVAAHCLTDSLTGLGLADAAGDVTVGAGLTGRDFQQGVPDLLLKIGTGRAQGKFPVIRCIPGEVAVKPIPCSGKDGQIIPYLTRQIRPKSGDGLAVAGDGQLANRGRIAGDEV